MQRKKSFVLLCVLCDFVVQKKLTAESAENAEEMQCKEKKLSVPWNLKQKSLYKF